MFHRALRDDSYLSRSTVHFTLGTAKILKHPQFQPELEHRLVWVTDRKVQEQLPIKVPEARTDCQKAMTLLGTALPMTKDAEAPHSR
jgi:hypothetical protein